MAVYETYSKRQKCLRGEFNDVYQHDKIPQKLRVQICNIYDSLFDYNAARMNAICDEVHYIIVNEDGKDRLEFERQDIEVDSNKSSIATVLISFAKRFADTDSFLTILELIVGFIYEQQECGNFSNLDLDEVIEEINIRFRESAVGYHIEPESLTIVRIDSNLVHSEVMQPVLGLLNSDPLYAGALHEFMTAHEHYRYGRYREAISNCGNSFESIMKAIHEKRGWNYEKGKATASPLIDSCAENGLFPSFQKEQLNQLKCLLRCGVPNIRNKVGSHGVGTDVTEVPEHLVSYMIHLMATNLLFLANAEKVLD